LRNAGSLRQLRLCQVALLRQNASGVLAASRLSISASLIVSSLRAIAFLAAAASTASGARRQRIDGGHGALHLRT
jgi:hypothetical protein